jgi:hypothetical protein
MRRSFDEKERGRKGSGGQKIKKFLMKYGIPISPKEFKSQHGDGSSSGHLGGFQNIAD